MHTCVYSCALPAFKLRIFILYLKKYAEEIHVHVLDCVVLFLFFLRRVAGKDKRIAHLEEKVTDLKEARTRRAETVS